MKDGGWVYMTASKKMGTIYIGSTSDLLSRILQHKNKLFKKSFTAKYNVDKLVYYEWHDDLDEMVRRERQLKEWHRNWKVRLIIQNNPEWKDLCADILKANGYSTDGYE
ncbi:MAG: GIY-YIG nuclease family protein [Rickettsiales bacterium]|jgi:putative endonuclease|nr:GIY-YIG nuclease family protein [Rickettsiales bacterium]